jgi:hypothetical protein
MKVQGIFKYMNSIFLMFFCYTASVIQFNNFIVNEGFSQSAVDRNNAVKRRSSVRSEEVNKMLMENKMRLPSTEQLNTNDW